MDASIDKQKYVQRFNAKQKLLNTGVELEYWPGDEIIVQTKFRVTKRKHTFSTEYTDVNTIVIHIDRNVDRAIISEYIVMEHNCDGVIIEYNGKTLKSIKLNSIKSKYLKLDMPNNNIEYLFFTGMTLLVYVDLRAFNSKHLVDMDGMFHDCINLKKCDIKEMDIHNVKTMKDMFSRCSSLEEIDLSGLDTSNIRSMRNMFYECIMLKKVNLTGLNTHNVRDMSHMFYMCMQLSELDISTFDTSSVKFFTNMFYHCYKLGTIDLSHLDFSSAEDTSNMFI